MTVAASSLPRDQAVRDRIREDLGTTFVVEAAAGTGKTSSLVSRMIGLVESGVPVSEIAAITFTRKAAAELRTRFQVELEKASRGDENDTAACRQALRELHRCYIGTIHSFCARLLRERPVEAGVSPGFREVEQDEATHLNNRFWDEYVERLHLGNDPVVSELEKTGVSFNELRESYLILCDNLDVDFASAPAEKPDLREAFETVSEFVEEAADLRPDEMPEGGWDGFQKELPSLRRMARRTDPDNELEVVLFLERLEGYVKITYKKWERGEGKRLKDELEDHRRQQIRPALAAWRRYVHPILVRAIGDAPQYAQQRRIQMERLSFHDLLLLARDLLRDHPSVRRYFADRFSRVLVDEFQDTDPVQTEILFYLTGDDYEQTDWRELEPRAGSLFIVGDPKQSIYRFRRADIALYRQVAGLVEESGGEILSLSTNFRSGPELCGWFNETFPRFFGEQATESQAAMVEAVPYRQVESPCQVVRMTTKFTSRYFGDDEIEAEASRVAEWIDRAVRGGMMIADEPGKAPRPVRFSDFLLIALRRTKIRRYASALEEKGIPYEITGGRGFSNAEELALLRPLLRAVVDPDDEISAVAFLASELCGVDDETLLRHSASGGFNYLRESKGLAVSEGDRTDDDSPGRAVLDRGFRLLEESWRDARTLSPGAAFARILDRTGLIPLSATRERGQTRSGTLFEVLTIARDRSAKGWSFAEIVEHLEEHLDAPDRSELEEMSADPARDDVVRLMNLHQAKGLEAPIVFLVDPRRPTEFEQTSYVDRSTMPPSRYQVFEKRNGPWQTRPIGLPPDWAALSETEARFEEDEKRRLLYVAATRARNQLIIGVGEKRRKLEGFWADLARDVGEELEMPPEPEESLAEPSEIDIEAGLRAHRDRLSSAREIVLAPSWAEATVTRIARQGPAAPATERIESLDGTLRGRIIHRLLESLMRTPDQDVELMTRNLLVEEGVDPREAAPIVDLIGEIRSSELWRRASESPRAWVEVPFAISTTAESLGQTGSGEVLLRGAIDLVFEEEDEWVVVDYKTDSVEGRLEALTEHYRPQVELYARYWTGATGQPARPALWFVESGEEVWL